MPNTTGEGGLIRRSDDVEGEKNVDTSIDFSSLPEEIKELIEDKGYADSIPDPVLSDLFGKDGSDGGPPYDISEYSEREGMMREVTDPEKFFDNLEHEKEEELRQRAINRGRFESEEELENFEPGVTVAFKRSLKNYLKSLFTKRPEEVSTSNLNIKQNENRYRSNFLDYLYRSYDRGETTTKGLEDFLESLLDTLWKNREKIEKENEVVFFRDEISGQLGVSSIKEREQELQQELDELRSRLKNLNKEVEKLNKHSHKSGEKQRSKKNEISRLEQKKDQIKERIAEISEEKSKQGPGLQNRSEFGKVQTQREDEKTWLESLAYEMQRMSASEVAIVVSELLEEEARDNEAAKILVESYLDGVLNDWAQKHSGEGVIKDGEADKGEEWQMDGEKTQRMIGHAKGLIESFYRRSDDEEWKAKHGDSTLAELDNALNILARKVETSN
ncbi:MAG: hypothetical protein ABEJ24_04800 [Candidatus Magasanikbacteria bacterium]